MYEKQEGISKRITRDFTDGKLLISRTNAPATGWQGLPEVYVTDDLVKQGATEIEIRLFVTFTAALDRARDADALWKASERLFLSHKWTFIPEEVVGKSQNDLIIILKSFNVSQRHKPDSNAWKTIAFSLLYEKKSVPIREAIYNGRGEASQLLKTLSICNYQGKACFPFLRGPKIGPMWIRMLVYPGKAHIDNIINLPVSVDVQVRKVSEYLGITDTINLPSNKVNEIRKIIQEAWYKEVQQHGSIGPGILANTSSALDPALWFFGKWGCTHCENIGYKQPISEICNKCTFTKEKSKLLKKNKVHC